MKKSIMLFLLTYVFASFTLAEKNTALNTELNKAGFSISMSNDFKVTKADQTKGEMTTFYKIQAEKGNSKINIDITQPIEKTEAQDTISNQKEAIEKLYGPQATPYAGSVTNSKTCGKEFKPQKIQKKILGEKVEILTLSANDRFQFGICDEKEIKYKSLYVALYSNLKKSVLEIKIFAPKTDYDEKKLIQLLQSLKVTK